MKHLNANLDNITSLELKETPVGVIRAVGVDSARSNRDGDLVAIPGIEYNPTGGVTIPAGCELFGVSTITLGGGTGSSPIVFDAAVELTIPITQGEKLDFFLNTDVVGGLIPDGTEPQFTLVAAADFAVGATGVSVTDESVNLLLATDPLQFGTLNNTTLANCTPAITTAGPGGGDLCVTGNLLLGGSLTDKDGNDIIVIGDDGEVEVDGDLDVDGDITGGDNNCTPIMGSDLISVTPAAITNQGSTVIKIKEGSEEDYLTIGETITFMCGTDSFDGEITDVQIAVDTQVGDSSSVALDYTVVAGINSYNPQAELDGNGMASGVLTLQSIDSLMVGDYLIVPAASQSLFGGEDRLEVRYLLDDGTKVGVQYTTTNPVSSDTGVTIPVGITFTAIRETTTSTTTITQCLDVDVALPTGETFNGDTSDFAGTGGGGHDVLAGHGNPPTNGFGRILNVMYDGVGTAPANWDSVPSWNPGWGSNPYKSAPASVTSLDIVDSFSITDQLFTYWNGRIGWPIPQDGELWRLRTTNSAGLASTSGIYRVEIVPDVVNATTTHGFGRHDDPDNPHLYTGTAPATNIFRRVDTSALGVGFEGALNSYRNDAYTSSGSPDYRGSFALTRLTNQDVVGPSVSNAPTVTSTFSAGVFQNVLTVPLALLQQDARYNGMSAGTIAAALPGELEIELAGLDQKRKATVQGSTVDSVSFLFNFTGAALSYTPTDGDFIIQKIQTITDTVADSVESAESMTTREK